MTAFWMLSKLSEMSNSKTRAHCHNDHTILRTNGAMLAICYQSLTVTDVIVNSFHSCIHAYIHAYYLQSKGLLCTMF